MLRVSRKLHFRINSQILVQFRFFIQKKRKLVSVMVVTELVVQFRFFIQKKRKLVSVMVVTELVIKSLFLFPLFIHLLVSLTHSLTLS